MAEPFVWGAGGAQMTPERIASERRVAQAMMARGMDYSPIRSPWQGAARVAEAMMGGHDSYRADEAEKSNMATDKEFLSGLPGMIQNGSANTPPPPVAAPAVALPAVKPDATVPIGMSRIEDGGQFAPAISSIESGGKYDILGPVTKTGDRAYGKYQVMGANVGPWTKQYLGQEMTPEQFLRSPEAQDAVFKGEFGRLAEKHGPNGASRAWFAGEGGMNNPNAKDQLGTTVSAYADKFSKALGPQVASLDPTSGIQASPGVRAVSNAMVPIGTTEAPPAQVAAAGVPAVAAAQAPTLQASTGMNPKLLQAIASPYASEGTKKIAALVLQHQMQGDAVTTVDLGNEIGVMDKRGNLIRRMPKGEPNKGPEFGIIEEDEYGNKKYGWKNPRDQSVTPYTATQPKAAVAPAAAVGATTSQAAPAIPPPPSGVNPKVWRDEQTKIAADAAGGKLTEVQANSTSFANRMEDAERNLRTVEPTVAGGGLGILKDRVARGVTEGQYNPIPRGATNWAVSNEFQQYDQAKSQFITAMLRRESGAAISPAEFERYDKEYFPQAGEPNEVLHQKQQARKVAIEGMKKGAGPGYTPPSVPAAAPKDMDPKLWGAMTSEERALWK